LNALKRLVGRLGPQIPSNLCVFIAAIFLSNAVNLFNMVYGGDSKPLRSDLILISSAVSVLSAAMWTALAAKLDLIEKTAMSATQVYSERERIIQALWSDVALRFGAYLILAIGSSFVALVVLIV